MYEGQRVDAPTLRRHLLGMEDGARRGAAAPLTTIICGPQGFNEHCERLVRGAVADAEAHAVVVLDA